jgi:hypothetical protein
MLSCKKTNPITNPVKLIVFGLSQQSFSTEKEIAVVRLYDYFALPKHTCWELSTALRGREPYLDGRVMFSVSERM